MEYKKSDLNKDGKVDEKDVILGARWLYKVVKFIRSFFI